MSCEFIKFNGSIRVCCVATGRDYVASNMLLPASIQELWRCILEAVTPCAAGSRWLSSLY